MIRRLVLVRHGQTVANAEGRFISVTDPGLDPQGKDQASRLGDLLGPTPVDLVISSPRRRCVETMDAIVKARDSPPTYRVDDRLVELGMGDIEGLSRSDIAERGLLTIFERWRQGIPPAYPDNAERFENAAERLLPVLREAVNTDADTVVIVGHSHALRILIAVGVLGGTADMHRRLFLGHGTYTDVQWELGHPRLKTLNGRP